MNKKLKFDKTDLVCLILVVVGIIIDQFTKDLTVKYLGFVGNEHMIFGDWFGFQYVLNDGAAGNALSGNRFVLCSISIVASILMVAYYLLNKNKLKTPVKVSIALILSGAIGNGIDRCFRPNGYVVDMIYFNFLKPIESIAKDWDWYPFPTFNIADILVTWTAVFLIIYVIFFEKDKD